MEVEEQVVEETKKDTEPKWDKERQRADQAEANLRKQQAKLAETELKSQQMEKTVSELQAKLEQIESVGKLDFNDIDPNEADIPDVVKEQVKMQKALKDAAAKLTALEQKASKYEMQAQEAEQERAREKAIEKIMKPLDDEFGSKFRNEARKLAEAEVAERGYAPTDSLEAYQILRRHYNELSKKTEEKKKATPSDSGRGGPGATFGDNISEGALDDVMGQIRKGGGLKALLNK